MNRAGRLTVTVFTSTTEFSTAAAVGAFSALIANPTSNHIYQAIGYRPVCNVHEYRFAAAPD